MFLTCREAQIDQLGLFAPEFSAWAYVEHMLIRPWFYVSTTDPGDDFGTASMIMACSEPMLGTILSCHGTTLRVESILLVSPGHVNKTAQWKMEPLERLERYTSFAGTSFVYHLADGRTYTYGDENAASALVVDRDQIFSTSMIITKKDKPTGR